MPWTLGCRISLSVVGRHIPNPVSLCRTHHCSWLRDKSKPERNGKLRAQATSAIHADRCPFASLHSTYAFSGSNPSGQSESVHGGAAVPTSFIKYIRFELLVRAGGTSAPAAAAATPDSVIRARCTLRHRSRPRRTALCLGGGEGSGVAGLCWSPGQTWLHQPQPRTAHLTLPAQRFEGGAHCP